MVEELIDRCDIITSASMAGSFKPILDSTNNIITRNPRVKERFDLPYLIRRDPDDWRRHDGGLALCKLMPLEGKAWAGANGDWVVYIGSNCEWELVNVYTCHRVPLQKSQTAQRLSTPVMTVLSTMVMVTVIYRR